MKDQYFGDVNDYRKYGLLRNLVLPTKLKLGVCWMLTERGGKDGGFLSYLQNPQRFQRCDPVLYGWLKTVVGEEEDRRVARIETSGLLGNAVFQSRLLTDSGPQRNQYFAESAKIFRNCNFVFFDPDNGIQIDSVRKGSRTSAKFVFWNELQESFLAGASVLVYQHFRRVQRTPFICTLADEFRRQVGARSVFSFRTPHVVFLLAAQEQHVEAFRGEMGIIDRSWGVKQSRIRPQIVPSECDNPLG